MARGYLQDKIGAIADFTKAIEINPNYEEAYYNKGNAKGMLKEYREAIADFTKAIEINPNYAEAYFGKGLAEIELGQKDSGCSDLSNAGELGFEKAQISMFDLAGRKIHHLVEKTNSVVEFDKDLKNGAYILLIKAGPISKTFKIIKID